MSDRTAWQLCPDAMTAIRALNEAIKRAVAPFTA